ncbi:hypothetical protein [Mechercharimyces sp. CAU 1602]|uniref:hypothetical protein n=1 Tax=Mechercharimyces sp. CAU 1602 TaxID=2973933 RepID=UPI002161C193|nr:hypothetical protein [Mechercharimyces sp. CAU 1602]MCS1351688.1 hypothetical protein [Mechercharimyces sp. CAU 1602]
MESKTYTYKNAIVTIYSPLANMSEEEKKMWYSEQWENGNPLMYEIADAIRACEKSIIRSQTEREQMRNSKSI